jgi:hypothetical protein
VNDSTRKRGTRPTKRVLLVGTRHDYQCPGYQGSEQFRVQVEASCRKHGITLLAEEMSLDALRRLGAHSSVCREVADSLGIAHRYCDPSIEELKQLGIANPCKFDSSSFSLFPDPRAIDPEIVEANAIRRKCWLQRISEADSWPVLFVCGANHVTPFRVLLQDNGVVVDVLFPVWPPN